MTIKTYRQKPHPECEMQEHPHGVWVKAHDYDDAVRLGNRLAELLDEAPNCVCETPTNHCRGCMEDNARAKAIEQWKEVTR